MLEDYFPEFITVTCYEWLPLISSSNEKEIIIQSLPLPLLVCNQQTTNQTISTNEINLIKLAICWKIIFQNLLQLLVMSGCL